MSAIPTPPQNLVPRDVQLEQQSQSNAGPIEQTADQVISGGSRSNIWPTTASDTALDNTSRIAGYSRNLNKVHYDPAEYGKPASDSLGGQRLITYPYDLATSPENMDYIIFDIYESAGAGIDTIEEKIESGNVVSANTQIAGIVAGANIAKDTVAKVGSGVALSALNQVGTLASGFSGLASGAARAAADPNLGKGEIGFSQQKSGFNQATSMVKTSIALYMPPTVESKYGMDYESKDFSMMGDLAAVGKNIVNALGSLVGGEGSSEAQSKAADAAMQVVGQQSLKMFDKFVGGILGGEGGAGLEDVVNAQNRAVPNPMILQLFKEVKRREFSFTYEFVPVNEREALNVYNIIRTFKKYSHPKRAVEGRYLEFPAEFRITYMQGTDENLYLPRIARCVLTAVGTKYGTETYASFAPKTGRNGSPPAKVELTLTFSEVEILTQERIDQGY